MRTEELPDYLADIYFVSDINALLIGPPGIGKSTGVLDGAQKIAAMLNKEFVDYDDSWADKILADPEHYFLYVDFNLNDCEPSDLTGIPKENHVGMAYRPFLWALCLAKATGLLFLDELTNIQRLDVITASYKIVNDHRSGFTKFRKDVMLVAAGNSPEESSVANLLPNPLIDRFTQYKVELPQLAAWAVWMDKHFGDVWDRKTLAYLQHFPDEFLDVPEETATLVNFPTPRSWSKVARIMMKMAPQRREESTVGSLGPKTGGKFSAFVKTAIPEVSELLEKPQLFKELNFDQKYLVSVIIGAHLKKIFDQKADEKERVRELIPAIPLVGAIKDVQHDLLILLLLSCGGQKQDIALALSRKDKEIAKILEGLAVLRMKVEA